MSPVSQVRASISSPVQSAPSTTPSAAPATGLQGLAARRRASLPSGMGMTAEQLASQLAGLGEPPSEPEEVEEEEEDTTPSTNWSALRGRLKGVSMAKKLSQSIAARRGSAPALILGNEEAEKEQAGATSWAALKGRLSGVSMMKKLAGKARDQSQNRGEAETTEEGSAFLDPLEAARAAACLGSPKVVPPIDVDTGRSPWQLLKMTAQCGPASSWRPDEIIAEEKQEYLLWALQNLPPPDLKDLLQDLQKSVSMQKDRTSQMNKIITNVVTDFASRSKAGLQETSFPEQPIPKDPSSQPEGRRSSSLSPAQRKLEGGLPKLRNRRRASLEGSRDPKGASLSPADPSADQEGTTLSSPRSASPRSHRRGSKASTGKSPRSHSPRASRLGKDGKRMSLQPDGDDAAAATSGVPKPDNSAQSTAGSASRRSVSANAKVKRGVLSKLRDGTLEQIAATIPSSVKEEKSKSVKEEISESPGNDNSMSSPSVDLHSIVESTVSTAPTQEVDVMQASLVETSVLLNPDEDGKSTKKKRSSAEVSESPVQVSAEADEKTVTRHGVIARKFGAVSEMDSGAEKLVGGAERRHSAPLTNDADQVSEKEKRKHRRASVQTSSLTSLGSASQGSLGASSANAIETSNTSTETKPGSSYEIIVHADEGEKSSLSTPELGAAIKEKRSSIQTGDGEKYLSSKEKRSSIKHNDLADGQKPERTLKRSSSRRASAIPLENIENAAENNASKSEAVPSSTAKLTKAPSTHKLAKSLSDATGSQSPSSKRRSMSRASLSTVSVPLASEDITKALSHDASHSPIPKMDKKSRRSSLPKDQSFTAHPHAKAAAGQEALMAETQASSKKRETIEVAIIPASEEPGPRTSSKSKKGSQTTSQELSKHGRKDSGKIPKSPKSKEEQAGSSKVSSSPRDGHSVKPKHEPSGTAKLLSPPTGGGHKRPGTDSRKSGRGMLADLTAGAGSRSTSIRKKSGVEKSP
eukprot:gnl/MRDRNA2_/MRDRNA2_123756_c0_seq1.p1 gnl/MRDRNA2_/MRDRNA2_123756_c0~~gnl/MRDRNA2_/MRDRNA2_123756_c0_seq1.p1  ORF type:complete len:1077 (-),score=260.12 gnl/MRDRNA2_/MRDRNA2_123756_c0_seq1:10-2949(-)